MTMSNSPRLMAPLIPPPTARETSTGAACASAATGRPRNRRRERPPPPGPRRSSCCSNDLRTQPQRDHHVGDEEQPVDRPEDLHPHLPAARPFYEGADQQGDEARRLGEGDVAHGPDERGP